MKRFVISTITAGTLAAAALGFAGAAGAAASGPGSPTDVVRQLESKGYEVIVTTTSGGQSQHCSITSVRPGQTFAGKNKEIHGVQTPVQSHKTMYVDQRC